MSLTKLLPPQDIPGFLADAFQRVPFAKTGGATACAALASRAVFERVCLAADADVMIVRRNRRAEASRPTTAEELQQILAAGNTVLIRHAERHAPELAHFANEFAKDFATPVNLHLYCTPSAEQGFGWHYDAEEVFLIQGEGRKEYSLRKNTVNPWPIEETLPDDMRYERERMPLMKCLLAPGDWLYIPSGYWHCGAATELAVTLAAGVQPRTALDLFDHLRRTFVESLLWRQRLPVVGRATSRTDAELEESLRQLAADLCADFRKTLDDPALLQNFMQTLRSSACG